MLPIANRPALDIVQAVDMGKQGNAMRKENWKKHSYASCCGVSDHVLWQTLDDNPNIGYVYLCLDSDEPGQAAAHRISRKLSEKGIQSKILVPVRKDWNEDLLYENAESEDEEPCQALVL